MSKLSTVSGLTELSVSQQSAQVERAKTLSSQKVKSEKEVEKATAGFEALLLHQMLKSMWETVEPSGFLGDNSNQAEIYRDMLNQAIADSVAEGRGIGVKQYLRKELLKQDKDAS